jgi:CBS domain-containing protein
MSKKILSVSPGDDVQKFISLMEKHHIQETIVVDKKKLVGSVRFGTLVSKGGIADSKTAKIKRIMESPPPTVGPNDNIDRATELMLNSGVRILPVVDKRNVVGVLSIIDIIENSMNSASLKKTKVEEILSTPVTISDDTDLGKTRVLMREHNVSRVPIVDNKGDLVGIVTVFDLLTSMKQPRERMNYYSMAAEMDRIMGVPITTVMNRHPVTASSNTKLNEIGELMIKRKVSGIVIVKNNKPIGLVTIKDLLEVLSSGLFKGGVEYQIIGLGDEDAFVVNTVERMVQDTLTKLTSIYKAQFFFIHVKRKETGLRSKVKYSIRVRFMTDKGLFMSKAWAWDLREAIGQALDNLERIVIKDKETVTERSRRGMKKLKRRR